MAVALLEVTEDEPGQRLQLARVGRPTAFSLRSMLHGLCVDRATQTLTVCFTGLRRRVVSVEMQRLHELSLRVIFEQTKPFLLLELAGKTAEETVLSAKFRVHWLDLYEEAFDLFTRIAGCFARSAAHYREASIGMGHLYENEFHHHTLSGGVASPSITVAMPGWKLRSGTTTGLPLSCPATKANYYRSGVCAFPGPFHSIRL